MITEGYKCADQAEDKLDFKQYLVYFDKLFVQIIIVLLMSILLYANSIHAPFYLDDYSSIVENKAVHQLNDLSTIWQFSQARFIGYLSFAFNYSDHHSTSNFHLMNISIHFFSGVAVLFLLRGLLLASNNIRYLSAISLLGALFFITAPLQTQAITYIVQRLASMAALFYMLSMVFYVYARLKKQGLLFFPVAIFALLAFFTKQNTATLPFALLLIEALFFHTFTKEHLKRYIGFGLMIITLMILALLIISGFDVSQLDKITRDPQTIGRITRTEYFSTQLVALWHYIYLFFVPLSLHIDYDFPLQKSLLSLSTIMAFLAHLAVISVAFIFRKKQPLFLFAVVFYYLAHAVESSFLPIFDVFFEHRAYLPNLGLALLTSLTLIGLLQRMTEQDKNPIIIVIIILLLLSWFSYLTYQRNNVWNNPIELYQEETRLSPNKERVWAALGKYYLTHRQYEEALQSYGKALNLARNDDTLEVLPTTLLNTYFALLYTNQFDKAVYIESLIPVEQLTQHDKSIFYFMKGNRLSRARDSSGAIVYLKKALLINPDYLDAKSNLAANYMINKEFKISRTLLNEVLAIQPNHNTALIYLKQINNLGQ
ncbi:MAG: hypothetical protein KAI02_02540 [Gammaproteobacteria bacterium]|nr:hypothetical protein [Gammaproteobacteria bacterium]